MDRHLQRARNAARLASLTRAAYSAGEGLLPEAEPDDEHDDEIPFDPPTRQRGERTAARRRWRVGLTPRAGLGLVLAVVLLVVVLAVRSLAAGNGEPVPVATSPGTGTPGTTVDAEAADAATPSPTAAGVVVVHVAGEVVSPGVVTLAAGSRVQDAVAAAGGPSPQADLGALNLARVVADGEQVYVPAPGEAPPADAGSGGTSGGDHAGAGGAAGVVNVNTADLATLDTLPGIGPALAQRILDWRTANGPFTDVAELTEVSGIGPATLERLLPLVTV